MAQKPGETARNNLGYHEKTQIFRVV